MYVSSMNSIEIIPYMYTNKLIIGEIFHPSLAPLHWIKGLELHKGALKPPDPAKGELITPTQELTTATGCLQRTLLQALTYTLCTEIWLKVEGTLGVGPVLLPIGQSQGCLRKTRGLVTQDLGRCKSGLNPP
ncbi:proenkephalin-A [Platysternon megacephalum]|uniref:Proenkephalin-A n=1 Tax=Platysternon megacephalum TaxID=55544 RepID=A0A4D9ELQ0_9SAUR|nr:proenkephalin-A [Platysternon megacephalum]